MELFRQITTLSDFDSRDTFCRCQRSGSNLQAGRKVSFKARQKATWVHRSFYCKEGWFLRHRNTLFQPHLDYCSLSANGPLRRAGSSKCKANFKRLYIKNFRSKGFKLLERLKVMKIISSQRRFERYKTIYVLKILKWLLSEDHVTWAAVDE